MTEINNDLEATSITNSFTHPNGNVFSICEDNDGYIMYKPDSSRDAWGTGYTLSQVKSSYGLGNIKSDEEIPAFGCK